MSKRDRQICALVFAVVWIPLMVAVWWVSTVMTQAMLGLVLVANDVPPGPIINEISSWDQTFWFSVMGAVGLVLGCLGCRYGPEPLGPPPPPEPFH